MHRKLLKVLKESQKLNIQKNIRLNYKNKTELKNWYYFQRCDVRYSSVQFLSKLVATVTRLEIICLYKLRRPSNTCCFNSKKE